jgi:hypothetical protein
MASTKRLHALKTQEKLHIQRLKYTEVKEVQLRKGNYKCQPRHFARATVGTCPRDLQQRDVDR